MALVAANIREAYTVPAGGTLTGQVVEDALSVTEVLLPKLVFINFHDSDAVTLTITRLTDLGVSGDPEDDGSVTESLVTDQSIAAGESYTYTPDFQNLVAAQSTPCVQHLLAFDNGGGSEDIIVQMFISGMVEEATRTTILQYERQT